MCFIISEYFIIFCEIPFWENCCVKFRCLIQKWVVRYILWDTIVDALRKRRSPLLPLISSPNPPQLHTFSTDAALRLCYHQHSTPPEARLPPPLLQPPSWSSPPVAYCCRSRTPPPATLFTADDALEVCVCFVILVLLGNVDIRVFQCYVF